MDWIPVSTGKFPEIGRDVLVTYDYGTKARFVEIAHWTGERWSSIYDEYLIGRRPNILAWMSMIKPYNG